MLLCMQREMETAVGSQFDISKENKENVDERMTTISCFIAKQQPSALGSRRKAEIHKSLKLSHFEIEHTVRRTAFYTQAMQWKVRDTPPSQKEISKQ